METIYQVANAARKLEIVERLFMEDKESSVADGKVPMEAILHVAAHWIRFVRSLPILASVIYPIHLTGFKTIMSLPKFITEMIMRISRQDP